MKWKFWLLISLWIGLSIKILLSQDYLTCLPSSWVLITLTEGCDTIYKEQHIQVIFPGAAYHWGNASPSYKEYVILGGWGRCQKKPDCNPIVQAFSPYKQECWPVFNSPVRSYGHWSQTVYSNSITQGIVGMCGAIPLIGPKCFPDPFGDTTEINCDCE